MENRIVLFLLLFSFQLTAQNITRNEYIAKYKDEAIYQMIKYKIPASIKLAQGILESGDGNSELAKKSNNHFGIKCHSNWEGDRVFHNDDKKNECFRKYNQVKDSFNDHSEFLLKPRYATLFEYKLTDYKSWARGLKKAGYATNPNYAKLLIKIIKENDLDQFDLESNESTNKYFFSGFSLGWTDLISQSILYKNDKKEYYLHLRATAAINNLALMLGGGKLITSKIGLGTDFGFMTSTGDINNVEIKPNYSLSSHFFIPFKYNQISIRLSLSTTDVRKFNPVVSIGFLR